MRVILETTKDTPTETMRFMLDLPPTPTRQKVGQVEKCFNAVENPHEPLHEAVKDTKGCRLGQDKSRMGQAEDQSCKYASRQSSSKPRTGNGTNPIPAS